MWQICRVKNQFLGLLVFLSTALVASAQTTAFTYQGNLNDGGVAAGANYDMRFLLRDSQTNLIGSTNIVSPVTPSNGLFTVALDFGSASFNGNARWLEISIRPYGDTNPYVVLSPRQLITSTPYAIQSLNAATAGHASTATTLSSPLPGTNVTGTIPVSNLPTNVALLDTNVSFLNVTATQFNGPLAATSLTGTLPDARLSPNVALLNTNATFNGTVTATNFAGYGGGLTNVPGRVFDNIATGAPVIAQANTGYLATNDSVPVVVTLPASLRVGETVRVSGSGAAGWVIAQNAGQSILVANLQDYIGLSWKTNGLSLTWKGVASSVDGTRLVAVANGGRDYTSTNFGATWLQQDVINRNWTCVASSGDGVKLVGGVTGGLILTSTDSGASWGAHNPSANWTAVASSLDGTRLVGVINGGSIYVSTNSGNNWTQINTNLNWTGVTSSANGSNLVAVATGARIHISSNGGASWTPVATLQAWSAVASSSDGSKLVAVVNSASGQIFISADSGANWSAVSTPVSGQWSTVASSGDGSRLAAAMNPGGIYISTDSGASWTKSGGAPDLGWTSLDFSGDGGALVAVATASPIYVSSQASRTTTGTAGYLTGTRLSAIELEYIGDGEFMPVNRLGTIRAH